MKKSIIFLFVVLGLFCSKPSHLKWTHLSSENGDLEPPFSGGNQQTASAVFDVDMDGVSDFLVTERTASPSVVWYRRMTDGWKKYVVDSTHLRIEAGSAITDIDNDGDLDVVFGGDSGSNQIWWFENPAPDFDPQIPWNRWIVKNSGPTKHHDQIFADFDGDGRDELVFWNQNERSLFLADIPKNPKTTDGWEYTAIYTYSDDEVQQRGTYPAWKSPNEHEGLDTADIDGDGKLDIIGGGRWFKHIQGNEFKMSVIDETYAFTRSAAGDLMEGGSPEVVLVVGDGRAPMILYELKDEQWESRILIDAVQDGHSLDIVDVDGDKHLDIFCAEMILSEKAANAKIYLLFGDGKGGFTTTVVDSGYANHESRIADLDGDGDYDILGKPYTWKAPRLDVWLGDKQ
ncbi:VCBS repeat-containing protein [candidate division KSB1 bacterium]|nr:VCBS repeat-containing protein [candidate division KSB1 bacterium]